MKAGPAGVCLATWAPPWATLAHACMYMQHMHSWIKCARTRRLAPQVSGYMGASVGYPAGVLLKLRLTRANQSLECPIIMSTSYDDWKVRVWGRRVEGEGVGKKGGR
eukprot:1146135-Pelagomonas_calceolata.AAC.21